MLTYPNIDPILISLGPIHIRWYGLAYLAGLTLPFLCFKKTFKEQFKMSFDDCLNFISYIAIGVIIGGRLGYVFIYDLSGFLQSPLVLIQVWKGGMSYHGGAIGAIVGTIYYAKHHKIVVLALLDMLAFGSTIGIGLGRVANFINGELYGRVTTSALGMVFPMGGPLPRHPSQLYEAFFEGVVLFLLLWIIRKWFRPVAGFLGGVYLTGYGACRFFIEFFREPDEHMGFIFMNFSMGQILCFVEIVIGVCVMIAVVRKQHIHSK